MKILSANKFCILNTIVGPPEISVLHECSFRQIYCHPDLKKLWPTHEYMVDLCSRTYVKVDYPERENATKPSAPEQLTKIKLGYVPRLLVDQYLEGIPLILKIKGVEEIRKIFAYLKHEFARYSVPPSKVVLAISMDYGWDGTESSILEALSADERIFVKKFFSVLGPSKVKNIFEVYYKMISQFDTIKTVGKSRNEIMFYWQKGLDLAKKFLLEMGIGNIIKTFVLFKLLHFLNKIGPKVDLGLLNLKQHGGGGGMGMGGLGGLGDNLNDDIMGLGRDSDSIIGTMAAQTLIGGDLL